MVGIIGIIASLTVLGLSLVVTRIATTALSLTGLSWEAAKFQARSAFTGTGFTTREAETVVNHPVRRRIIMWLMVARSAGLVSIIISLILSFGSSGEDGESRLLRLLWLVAGVLVLWIVARSRFIERWMRKVIHRALDRWTDLVVRDYNYLLNLSGHYSVSELNIEEQDWLADKKISDCQLRDEGILVLGIYRGDGSYVGAPTADTKIFADDTLILYGHSDVLKNLDQRQAGVAGETEHRNAISEQKKREEEQARKDEEYRKKKETGAKKSGR
jgi:hypothetical protein